MRDEPPRTCPVCGDDLGGRQVRCPLCCTDHHVECWEYNDGCGVFGCREEHVRRGLCTRCGRDATQPLDLGGRARDLDFLAPARPAPLAGPLCSDCTESRLLAEGKVPASALVALALLFFAPFLMASGLGWLLDPPYWFTREWYHLAPGVLALCAVVARAGFTLVPRALAQNAADLPRLPPVAPAEVAPAGGSVGVRAAGSKGRGQRGQRGRRGRSSRQPSTQPAQPSPGQVLARRALGAGALFTVATAALVVAPAWLAAGSYAAAAGVSAMVLAPALAWAGTLLLLGRPVITWELAGEARIDVRSVSAKTSAGREAREPAAAAVAPSRAWSRFARRGVLGCMAVGALAVGLDLGGAWWSPGPWWGWGTYAMPVHQAGTLAGVLLVLLAVVAARRRAARQPRLPPRRRARRLPAR